MFYHWVLQQYLLTCSSKLFKCTTNSALLFWQVLLPLHFLITPWQCVSLAGQCRPPPHLQARGLKDRAQVLHMAVRGRRSLSLCWCPSTRPFRTASDLRHLCAPLAVDHLCVAADTQRRRVLFPARLLQSCPHHSTMFPFICRRLICLSSPPHTRDTNSITGRTHLLLVCFTHSLQD